MTHPTWAQLSIRPTSVYRYFDADGRLLYVGLTSSGPRRMWQHADFAQWWPSASSCVIEHFADRATARAAEIKAIRTEWPAYNIESTEMGQVPLGFDPMTSRWVAHMWRLHRNGASVTEMARILGIRGERIQNIIQGERFRRNHLFRRLAAGIADAMATEGAPTMDEVLARLPECPPPNA